jgi:voltage-gated potassium channel
MNIFRFSGPLQKLYIAFFLLITSLSIGIGGYCFIAGYSLTDAFYMTVITASTTGFMEVEPLDNRGRIFTAFYIIFNLGLIAYFVSILTQYVFAGGLHQLFVKYMTNQKLNSLTDHTIVCGYGRNGRKSCEELLKENVPFVVIDNFPDSFINPGVDEKLQRVFLKGDATNDDLLKAAGIERAQSLITTLPKDADNVFITLTAREFNRKIKIIARASDESSVQKLYRAGANHVVMPDHIGGMHMAYHVTKPEVVEFMEILSGAGKTRLRMEEFEFRHLKQEFKNKSLRDLNIRHHTQVTVMGLKDVRHGFSINPNPDTIFHEGDTLVVLGNDTALASFKKMYMQE